MSPSPFIVQWVGQLARELDAPRAHSRALDVAAGRGRHSTVIALAGFRTFGVDVDLGALRDARAACRAAHTSLLAWCANLTQYSLPVQWFDVVVVTRYLQRDLFPALQQTVRPGGFLIYETFTTAQRALNSGPRSPDHLLEPDELRTRFDLPGWQVRHYEETQTPEAVARLAAHKIQSRVVAHET